MKSCDLKSGGRVRRPTNEHGKSQVKGGYGIANHTPAWGGGARADRKFNTTRQTNQQSGSVKYRSTQTQTNHQKGGQMTNSNLSKYEKQVWL